MTFSARHDSAPISGINITPLVDALLVLLVIFMISAPVIAHKASLSFPGTGTVHQEDVAKVLTEAKVQGLARVQFVER